MSEEEKEALARAREEEELARALKRDMPADASAAEMAAYVKGWCRHRQSMVRDPPYTWEEQRLVFALMTAAHNKVPGERDAAQTALNDYRTQAAKDWAERPLDILTPKEV